MNILSKIIYHSARHFVRKNNHAVAKEIPFYELETKHVANTKVLANRTDLLKLMPKGGVVAELGVFLGDFSKQIIEHTNPSKLHLVDVWASKRYNDSLRLQVEEKLKSEIATGQVEINLGLSTEVVGKYANNYFDWIYIDTDHSYATTKAELEHYAPKIKEGGIIAGHDYIIGNWNGVIRYGVVEAVHEFCVKNNWEILYISTEKEINPSFAIKKLANA